MKTPISIFIITQNEENNIGRLLDSVKEFDEIIIVDSGSTDNTLTIAKNYNVKIFHQDWLGYAKQKQKAMSYCKNDWVLNLDADEELPNELVLEIKNLNLEGNINGVRFIRNDFFIGKPLPNFCKLPSNLRMYKQSKSNFDSNCLVHESAVVEGKTITLKTPFNHYGYNDIESLAEKHNLYSTLKASEKHKKGKKHSLLKLLLIFPVELLKKLIIQRYLGFGWRGLILSIMNANYAFLKESKLFALNKNNQTN